MENINNSGLNDFIASTLDNYTISKTKGALLLCACNDRFNNEEIKNFFIWFMNSIMPKYSFRDEEIDLDDLKEKTLMQYTIERSNDYGYSVYKTDSNGEHKNTPERVYGITKIIEYYIHICDLYCDYFGDKCIPTYYFIIWAIDRETLYTPKRITEWKDKQDQIMYQSNKPTQKVSKNSTGRTQSATEARREKTLSEWKDAFKIMALVIMECFTGEPKKRTRGELQAMCSKCGGRLSHAQLDFLRDCLPDEHVNKEGGAPVQGTPS